MRRPPQIFFLVRHGAISQSLSGRWWGRIDVPLAADAEMALSRTASVLQAVHPTRLIASPAQRAVASATILQRTLRLSVEVVPALAEVDLGEFAGHTMAESAELFPAAWRSYLADTVDSVPPGGESFRRFAQRVFAWTRAQPQDQDIVVVTHTGVILALACASMGLDLADRVRLGQPPPASLSVLSLLPPVLHSFAQGSEITGPSGSARG
ncbi:MAG: histidine phosphatase family protein [Sulfobacillus sp.]